MALLKEKSKREDIRQQLYATLELKGESISETVKTLRKILAKDQEDFCKLVGISLSALRRIEQNRGNVTLSTIKKILDKFSLELKVKTKARSEG